MQLRKYIICLTGVLGLIGGVNNCYAGSVVLYNRSGISLECRLKVTCGTVRSGPLMDTYSTPFTMLNGDGGAVGLYIPSDNICAMAQLTCKKEQVVFDITIDEGVNDEHNSHYPFFISENKAPTRANTSRITLKDVHYDCHSGNYFGVVPLPPLNMFRLEFQYGYKYPNGVWTEGISEYVYEGNPF